MRVLSMVPSWTETLIQAGVEVCGRTRYCLHPQPEIKAIPIVGGTKEINWEKVNEIKPDLILFDQEENPKNLADQCTYPWIATHVTDLTSCQQEMHKLSQELKITQLKKWSEAWTPILEAPTRTWSFSDIPGIFESTKGTYLKDDAKVIYIIWKNPWMAVTRETYIGSVLHRLGAPLLNLSGPNKYPEVSEEILKNHFCLFSSEPFPFHKKKTLIDHFHGAVVDGEKYSWFGVRSLNFLKEALHTS